MRRTVVNGGSLSSLRSGTRLAAVNYEGCAEFIARWSRNLDQAGGIENRFNSPERGAFTLGLR